MAPVSGDTAVIAVTDIIDADTTGLACDSITLNGTLRFSRTANSSITIGNHTSDTLVTWGANGFWDQGTAASPIPATYTARVTLDPLSTSGTGSQSCFNMSACTGATKGFSIYGSTAYCGVAESVVHPLTGVTWSTRRVWSILASNVAASQASVVFQENLNVPTTFDFVLPGSHASNNGKQYQGEVRSVSSWTSGTKTLVAGSNWTNAHNVQAIGANNRAWGYSRASNATIEVTSGKQWGLTPPTSTSPIFEVHNCTLFSFYGNSSTFAILEGKTFTGITFVAHASSSMQGFRASNSREMCFINCLFDGFNNTNVANNQYVHCAGCTVAQDRDTFQTNSSAEYWDCTFMEVSQPIVNSTAPVLHRCHFICCTNATSVNGSAFLEDCEFIGCSRNLSGASAAQVIRPTFARCGYIIGNALSKVYIENPVILAVPTSGYYEELNAPTAQVGKNIAAMLQSPSGASAPTTVGLALGPGGTLTGFTTGTLPNAVSPAPSGAAIYNRLVTQSAILPSALGRSSRPFVIPFNVNVTAGGSFTYTINLRAISGYTPTSLSAIQLRLTLPGTTTPIITTVSSLAADVWTPITVSGNPANSGTASLEVYISANVGTIYIDFPLLMEPGGYVWNDGMPQKQQSRLADSVIAPAVALAVWEAALGTNSSGTKGDLLEKLLTENAFLEELAA